MRSRGTQTWSLTTRVFLFLTLALVPIGLISGFQNHRLNQEIGDKAELSMQALTQSAASGERQVIERAFGAAQTLASVLDFVGKDPDACARYLTEFQTSSELYSFVGFIGIDGISTCSNAGRDLDFSEFEIFKDLVANPRQSIEVNLQAPASGKSMMIVNQPVYKDNTLEGYLSLSMPLKGVGKAPDFGDANPLTLVTFNTWGQMVSSHARRGEAKAELPKSSDLATLAEGETRTFIAESASGEKLVYSVVPIIPDVVYALGAWDISRLGDSAGNPAGFNAILPFLMWLASLFVVWLVIDSFVIRRVKILNASMQRFARNRAIPEQHFITRGASELAELEAAFISMASDVVHDEAVQEDRIREKSILLKEVHHRVKNNLQIISSILNMQVRKAHATETKAALSQVQDRIIGLSGVHRTLYQSKNMNQVNAASLIRELVDQTTTISDDDARPLQIDLNLQDIIVYPDQAVPLSMFVSETLTNAVKYASGNPPKIEISLEVTEDTHAHLYVKNTRSEKSDEAGQDKGLGLQLIKAFAIQLEGRLNIDKTSDSYCVEVAFEVETFAKDTPDY